MDGVMRGRLAGADAAPADGEVHEVLWSAGGVSVEHIVSGRLSEPLDYVQDSDEWVMVLGGSGALEVGGERVEMAANEWIVLPAGTPHRVLSTEPGTRWLAVHVAPAG